MISNRRRYTIILISVSVGSIISLWIVKLRMGTLKPSDYLSLGLNFLFAAAMVVGLSILLKRMNNDRPPEG